MLTTATIEHILTRIPTLAFGVIGDLFLDRYLDIDAGLTEPSLETGLDAYQVIRVRSYPGAAGTVINNLVALGVKAVHAISVIGDDGEGYELRQALDQHGTVERAGVFLDPGRRTPTYTKPMLSDAGASPRELNRLDIKNHSPLVKATEDRVLDALSEVWPQMDGLLVSDQLDKRSYGVVTDRVVQRLAELGDSDPTRLALADSRERIGIFRALWLKPNQIECTRALGVSQAEVETSARRLADQAGRPVFCTLGANGVLVIEPRPPCPRQVRVAAFKVSGEIDIVGAGDSTSAGIACAAAAGASLEDAAAFGNLVASITIQQIGTTGTATPEQIRRRWREIAPEG